MESVETISQEPQAPPAAPSSSLQTPQPQKRQDTNTAVDTHDSTAEHQRNQLRHFLSSPQTASTTDLRLLVEILALADYDLPRAHRILELTGPRARAGPGRRGGEGKLASDASGDSAAITSTGTNTAAAASASNGSVAAVVVTPLGAATAVGTPVSTSSSTAVPFSNVQSLPTGARIGVTNGVVGGFTPEGTAVPADIAALAAARLHDPVDGGGTGGTAGHGQVTSTTTAATPAGGTTTGGTPARGLPAWGISTGMPASAPLAPKSSARGSSTGDVMTAAAPSSKPMPGEPGSIMMRGRAEQVAPMMAPQPVPPPSTSPSLRHMASDKQVAPRSTAPQTPESEEQVRSAAPSRATTGPGIENNTEPVITGPVSAGPLHQHPVGPQHFPEPLTSANMAQPLGSSSMSPPFSHTQICQPLSSYGPARDIEALPPRPTPFTRGPSSNKTYSLASSTSSPTLRGSSTASHTPNASANRTSLWAGSKPRGDQTDERHSSSSSRNQHESLLSK